jgi:hypothetical protein
MEVLTLLIFKGVGGHSENFCLRGNRGGNIYGNMTLADTEGSESGGGDGCEESIF